MENGFNESKTLFLADHATESYKPFVLTAMYQLYWFYKVLQKT